MTYATLKCAQDGAACILTLHRPEQRNAVSRQMMAELVTACTMAERDPDVSAVILHGGDAGFSSGADLNEALALRTSAEAQAYFLEWRRLNGTLEALAKPVIAAIEGYCVTGGLELALACDLRIAGDGATFAMTSARIGTVAGAGGTQRLPRLIGKANALAMLFSAEPIDAAEAFRIGLVNRLLPAGQALEGAKALAGMYRQRAPLGLSFAKRAVHQGLQLDLAAALDVETGLVTAIYGTRDKQEGISAFLEKRQPHFTGQ